MRLALGLPLFILFFGGTSFAAHVPTTRASLLTSYGRQLDPDYPRESMSLEPSFTWNFRSYSSLSARALLDRSFDLHKPLRVPFLEFLTKFGLVAQPHQTFGVFVYSQFPELQDWGGEGAQLRQIGGGYFSKRFESGLSFDLLAGPFLYFSEYAQRRNGQRFSQMGFVEQVSAAYQIGNLKFEFLFFLAQEWNGRWQNFYSTFERVSLRLTESLWVGLTHQLVLSHIDELTGNYSPVGVFDGRKSRVAGFLQWQL